MLVNLNKYNELKDADIFVIGAGGTGSWLASFLSKIDNEVYMIDGDIIEHKNIIRQNFTEDDIGDNKAEAIGERYNLNYMRQYIPDKDMLFEILNSCSNFPIIVGCVDNNSTRCIIDDVFKTVKNIAWIDSGNAERHGQVLIGLKIDGDIIYESPVDVEPALKIMNTDEGLPTDRSCADVSESAPQNVTANVTAAALTFDLINILIDQGMLTSNKISWDAATMSFMKETIKEVA